MRKVGPIAIAVSIVLLVALTTGFYFITGGITKYTGFVVLPDDDSLHECLEGKDVRLYVATDAGTFVTSNLNEYLSVADIVNCDVEGAVCEGFSAFPTWIVEGTRVDRDISVGELETLSGC